MHCALRIQKSNQRRKIICLRGNVQHARRCCDGLGQCGAEHAAKCTAGNRGATRQRKAVGIGTHRKPVLAVAVKRCPVDARLIAIIQLYFNDLGLQHNLTVYR